MTAISSRASYRRPFLYDRLLRANETAPILRQKPRGGKSESIGKTSRRFWHRVPSDNLLLIGRQVLAAFAVLRRWRWNRCASAASRECTMGIIKAIA
jgi:hypothetical protein